MASKYSDFIKLQDFLPVYDILDERSSTWQSFIPTQQFNYMLSKAIVDITSTEVSKRKSIWVQGTFGTGKSHASAVVKHLLCDKLEDIDAYIDNIKDSSLKYKLRNLRQNKRYFSVTLKGVEKAYDIPRFTLSLQSAVSKAMAKVAPNVVVNSDYKAAIDWINSHRQIFDDYVLAQSTELSSIVDSTEQVLSRLENFDISMYLTVRDAVKQCVGTAFEQSGISEWLVEMEHKLEELGIADGLIIFWDEFTSVMDTLKSDRINLLQNIAEKSQNNNVFLFLISHRVEAQSQDTKDKDISKMSDRFDEIRYAMDSLSTYLIMRHSYTIPNEECNIEYKSLIDKKITAFGDLLDFLTNGNANEKQLIEKLLPMHPYTAFLCSTISNYVGSSNRSVIKFMHDEVSGFGAFLNDENSYNSDKLLTADALWDFFYTEFDSDPLCATFTGIFTSFEGKVKAQGEDYLRVFKAILLLNALSPKFNKDIALLTPDEKVLRYVFIGDRASKKLTDILNYLDENKIVTRNIFDQFKITGTSYNQNEMNLQRQKEESIYKTAASILDFNTAAKEDLTELFGIGSYVRRETDFLILSCDEQESLIRSRLNKFTQGKPNYQHIAIFLSINEDDRESKQLILKNFSTDFEDLVIVVPEETFSKNNYIKFIDSIATSKVAKSHFNDTESKECEKIAKGFVAKWVKQLLSNTYTAYFNGKPYSEGTFEQFPELLKRKLGGLAFPKGFESVKFPSVADTFFTDKNCPKVILQILQAQTRDQIISHGGNASAIRYVFEENGNSLITQSGALSENAIAGNSWLAEVCQEMDRQIEVAKKKYADKFSMTDVFAHFIEKPFGMFTSFANCAAIAFAFRKHKADLFEPTISQPVSDEKLSDMITDMFKMWKDGKSVHNNKLLLRFGSPEESKLTELFIDIFDLAKMEGVKASEIKSLANVKWYVQEFCKRKAKYPLWTLKFLPSISNNIKEIIEGIISLFETENPSIEKIKSIYKSISLNKMDLNLTLTSENNYNKGFIAFVESIEEAPIKKEWWNDMLAKVNELPSEIAFRKETDVRQTIVKFYIEKMTPNPQPNPHPGPQPNPQPNPQKAVDTVLEAKNKVKSLNMPNMLWQKIALELIDTYPEIAEYFKRI